VIQSQTRLNHMIQDLTRLPFTASCILLPLIYFPT
jgi:hypothetical protein